MEEVREEGTGTGLRWLPGEGRGRGEGEEIGWECDGERREKEGKRTEKGKEWEVQVYRRGEY